ncbi:ParB/RepB/Spo0J family partition protein, partial [Azospirillum sp. B4]|uniref:ParB/RepB/Spo0J family partition protein n=1 Tax=Azospirillum sp. B4 TaxID=95605 RepID=UPI0011DD9A08
ARRYFDDEKQRALTESIGVVGQLVPVIVKDDDDGRAGHWTLVAGERRWRACVALGKPQILCIRQPEGTSTRAIQLIENLQRSDITPIEQARGVRDLINEEGLTQVTACSVLGLSEGAVSQLLTMLSDLSEFIVADVEAHGTDVATSLLYELSRFPEPDQIALWPSVKDGSIKRTGLRLAKKGQGSATESSSNRTAPIFRGISAFSKSLEGIRSAGRPLEEAERSQLMELRDRLNELLSKD